MNFNSTDNPVLVAPRPVRLTTPFPIRAHPMRLVSAPEAITTVDDLKLGFFAESHSDKELSSPRASPRAALPSEALEEFLSILKPSMFPAHTRRGASMPNFQHERSYSFKGRLETLDSSRLLAQSPDASDNGEFELVDPEEAQRMRWFTSSVLSSPISRNNTRNPFHRLLTPSPTMHHQLSPAAIPLPLPTPDEMA